MIKVKQLIIKEVEPFLFEVERIITNVGGLNINLSDGFNVIDVRDFKVKVDDGDLGLVFYRGATGKEKIEQAINRINHIKDYLSETVGLSEDFKPHLYCYYSEF